MVSDLSFSELNWRIAPGGEILDEWGGLIAGDSRTCLQSLEMRRLGTDRFERAPAVDTNAGAECMRRWAEAKREQADHVRIFGR